MSVQTQIVIPAIQDLGGVAPDETPSTSELNFGFALLNQIVSAWSNEGNTVINRVRQTFALVAGTSGYTLGSGGTMATTGGLRAMKVTSWLASSGDMRKGGAPLSLDEFAAQAAEAQKALAALHVQAVLEGIQTTVPSSLTAPIPTLLGADSAYPLANVRVWPPPSAAPGSVEIGYYTPLVAFVSLASAVSLADGFELAFRNALTIALCPAYGKNVTEAMAANAQSSKGAIVTLNQSIAPQQAQQ